MRKYEVLLILPPEADDQVIGKVTDRISQVVGPHGGQIAKVDRWGKRRLTYQIGRLSEGFYLVVELLSEPGAMLELERVLALADEVVRFKAVVLPEAPSREAGAA